MSWRVFILGAVASVVVVLGLFHSRTIPAEKVKGADAASPGDWIWEPYSATLDKVPPMFLLRPTKFPPNWVPFEMFGKDRYLAERKTVKQLIATVYSQKDSAAKLVFLAPLPEDKYDCLVTLQGQAKWWNTLEAQIDKKFNLVTQYEQRDGRSAYIIKSAN